MLRYRVFGGNVAGRNVLDPTFVAIIASYQPHAKGRSGGHSPFKSQSRIFTYRFRYMKRRAMTATRKSLAGAQSERHTPHGAVECAELLADDMFGRVCNNAGVVCLP